MAGFENDFMFAKNADFTQADNQNAQESNGLISNGQLWIGRTVANAGGTHIDVATLTPGTGIAITNAAGSITIANTGSMTDLHGPKFIVGNTSNGANYSTIAAAITAASSGDTIYIQTGTYTENLTLKANVNLSSLPCENAISLAQVAAINVKIVGKLTMTVAGSCQLSNILFQTNSDYILELTGSNNLAVTFFNCFFNGTNSSIFHSTNSNASNIYLVNCSGDLGTTGIAYFVQTTGTNSIVFDGGWWSNSGSSTTNSTNTGGGICSLKYVNEFRGAITTSGSSSVLAYYSIMNAFGAQAWLTHGGSIDSIIVDCQINSISGSALSVSVGSVINLYGGTITSSNTNAITGAGTLNYVGPALIGSSTTINTTTQTGFQLPLTAGTAAQVLTSNGAGVPSTWQAAGGGGGGALTWTTITGATQTLVAFNGYVTNRGGGITYTLPASGTLGDEIRILGLSGIWTIAQNAGQQILVGTAASTVGVTGTVVATNANDNITIICMVAGASTVWRAFPYQTTGFTIT